MALFPLLHGSGPPALHGGAPSRPAAGTAPVGGEPRSPGWISGFSGSAPPSPELGPRPSGPAPGSSGRIPGSFGRTPGSSGRTPGSSGRTPGSFGGAGAARGQHFTGGFTKVAQWNQAQLWRRLPRSARRPRLFALHRRRSTEASPGENLSGAAVSRS